MFKEEGKEPLPRSAATVGQLEGGQEQPPDSSIRKEGYTLSDQHIGT